MQRRHINLLNMGLFEMQLQDHSLMALAIRAIEPKEEGKEKEVEASRLHPFLKS